jgi:hypothetical protein
MKISNYSRFIITVFLSLSFAIGSAQTTHTIVLSCDTNSITKENVNKVCSFGQNSDVSNEDYVIEVNVGDIIVWRGVAKHSSLSSSIEMSEINYEQGQNLFGKNTIKDYEGIITAEVIQGQPGDEEKYNVEFKVFIDGRMAVNHLKIDPKIKIREPSIRR